MAAVSCFNVAFNALLCTDKQLYNYSVHFCFCFVFRTPNKIHEVLTVTVFLLLVKKILFVIFMKKKITYHFQVVKNIITLVNLVVCL